MNLRELRALSGMCQDFEVWEVEGEEPIAYGKNHYMTREFDEREVLNIFAAGDALEAFVELPPKEEPKPKETFIIDVTTILGQTFAIEADSIEDAQKKARELVNNRRFFDERLHAKWSYDGEWDATEVINVVDGWDCHGNEDFIAPEIVDSYLKGE